MSVGIVGLWTFGAFASAAFVVLLMASTSRRRRDKLLATTGRGAIGRVMAVGSDDDGMGLKMYWIRVQYSYDGEPVTAKVMVSYRDQQRYRAGQRVGLTYAPSRSQAVRLDPPEWALPKQS